MDIEVEVSFVFSYGRFSRIQENNPDFDVSPFTKSELFSAYLNLSCLVLTALSEVRAVINPLPQKSETEKMN